MVTLKHAAACIARAQELRLKGNITEAVDRANLASRFLDEFLEKNE